MSTSDWANLDELNERAEDGMTTTKDALPEPFDYIATLQDGGEVIDVPVFSEAQMLAALASKQAPPEWTPEMSRAVQLYSELGAYAAANLSGAYDLFEEFWRVAIQASRPAEAQAKSEPAASDARDAARYRWLRDNTDSDWAICEWSSKDTDGIGYYRDARAPNVVDAAVDAAIAAAQEQKP